MALPGRAPKPLEQKRLDGFPRKGGDMSKDEREQRLEAAQKLAPVGEPYPDMTDPAKAKWYELQRSWAFILKESDRENLRLYCETWCDMIEAQSMVILTGGPVIATATGEGLKVNPWVSRLDKSRDVIRRMLPEFGATPSARQRVDLSDPTSGGSKFGNLVN